MKKEKRIEVLQKKNDELEKRLDDLKFEAEKNKNNNKVLEELICEIEKIKKEFDSSLIEINKYKESYYELYKNLLNIRKSIGSYSFKFSLYDRIKIKLRRFLNK